jgi:hypothetical protein
MSRLPWSGARGDYTITDQTTTASITPRPITVTADAKRKLVGQADPELTYRLTGTLMPGDGFTGALTRVEGEDPGAYAIRKGTLTAGSNYHLTFVGANLTITTGDPLTLRGLTAQNKVYDGTTTAAISASPVTVTVVPSPTSLLLKVAVAPAVSSDTSSPGATPVSVPKLVIAAVVVPS